MPYDAMAPRFLALRHAAWVCVLLVAACGGGNDEAPTEVPFQDVSNSYLRPFAEATYVFRSTAELTTAWNAAPYVEYAFITHGETPMPIYDFSKETVVGISRGPGATFCNSPRITKVTKAGALLTVEYYVPELGTSICQRVGPRVGFAVVPFHDGAVEFKKNNPP